MTNNQSVNDEINQKSQLIVGKLFRHSGLVILVLGLVLLSLALSAANCSDQAENGGAQLSQDIKCVTCESTGVTFIWAVERDDLIGMLKSSSPGWVAVGFSSDESASAGKIVIGSVINGRPVVKVHKFFGWKLIPDDARLIEAHAAREQGATVVIFRAKLSDLGLADKVSKPLPVVLAKDATQEDFANYQNGVIGTVKITL